MARQSSILEDTANLPWQVGVVFAVLCYPVAVFFAKLFSSSQVLAGAGVAFLTIWPVFSGLFLLAALVSFLRGRKRQKMLQQNQSLEKIRGLSWRQFEQYVGEHFKDQGYFVVETPEGPDGGVDLVLRKDGEKTYVQCKHWKSSKVGVEKVRALLGSMTSGGAHNGIFVITGYYTQAAKQFGNQHGIQMIDGTILEKMVDPKTAAEPGPETSQSNPDSVLCPICEEPMVKRLARRGPNAGNEFWGCTKYPVCKGTRDISKII